MKASELVSRIQEAIKVNGDVMVFMGDMERIQIETVTAEQPEVYGSKYLFIGAP